MDSFGVGPDGPLVEGPPPLDGAKIGVGPKHVF